MTLPVEQLYKLTGTWTAPALLLTALTHRSYAHEASRPTECNERLEFLGDAIIDLVIGAELFQRRPAERAGVLTQLRALVVSEPALAAAARACGLGGYLRLGRGFQKDGGAQLDSLMADAFEAVIGAAYCDGGFVRARDLTLALLGPTLDRALAGELAADYKSRLNNFAQGEYGTLPQYRHTPAGPPAPGSEYCATVYVGERAMGVGRGKTKRAAEQAAAQAACGALNLG
ncbi:MAG TPA: ribonuclease III [bacterium]|mgnify:CR=1 FL=1|nr:ribonuclease III [bacterium]